MAVVRSALFALLFYPGTLMFVLSALGVVPLGSAAVRAVAYRWTSFYHWLVTRVVGIHIIVEGQVPPGPMLIAAKHQAMFETLEIMQISKAPIIVLKRELLGIPLFGRVLLAYGVIPVDRAAGAKALRAMLDAARRAVAEERPVAIFPEGTRVHPGTKPPLQPGFAGLYRALGLPVVPVALDSGRVWSRGFVKRPGTIRVLIGEPIEPGLPREAIEARVHAAINALEA